MTNQPTTHPHLADAWRHLLEALHVHLEAADAAIAGGSLAEAISERDGVVSALLDVANEVLGAELAGDLEHYTLSFLCEWLGANALHDALQAV